MITNIVCHIKIPCFRIFILFRRRRVSLSIVKSHRDSVALNSTYIGVISEIINQILFFKNNVYLLIFIPDINNN